MKTKISMLILIEFICTWRHHVHPFYWNTPPPPQSRMDKHQKNTPRLNIVPATRAIRHRKSIKWLLLQSIQILSLIGRQYRIQLSDIYKNEADCTYTANMLNYKI